MSSRRAALESLAIVGTLATIVIGIWGYATLPPSIAAHWEADGSVSYGPKIVVLLLPIVSVIVMVVAGIEASSGHYHANLPIRIVITPENRDAVGALELELLLSVRAVAVLSFGFIELAMTESAGGVLSPIFPFSLAFLFGGLIVLIVGYSVAIAKAAKPRPE